MNLYNENDPFAADWLERLIDAGHIPPGKVDRRSITELVGGDLDGYTQSHFFSGVAGWSEALRLAGWPPTVPVWTGSCPCQPFSAAGKRKGEKDERHLWPEFRRLIAECRPAVVIGEQVASKDGREWLSRVRLDLEALGYAVGAADLCAAGAGAPHIRQRLYWVANASGARLPRREDSRADCDDAGEGARRFEPERSGRVGRMADAEHGARRDLGELESPEGYGVREVPRQGAGFGVAGDSGPTRRLAHADGGESRDRGVQPSGQHGQQPEDGGVDRLEHTEGDRREQRRAESGGRCAASGRGASGLVDAEQSRLEGLRGDGEGGSEPGRIGTQSPGPTAAASSARFWDAFDLLPCTDGKTRRIEPGSFPLAHGIPSRVGRLRGYGNAIVPQVAATFIQAFLDVTT